MPFNANAFVHYGPYNSCGIVDHRTSVLKGLETLLEDNGHTVKLEKIDEWNKVKIYVNGKCVFTCDIRELDYGGDGKLDPLCREAAEAVKVAF